MSAGTSYTYSFEPPAYAIPLLHAARYLSHTVIGLFLGRPVPGSTTSEMVLEDALPLIHHYTSLAPMMEVALELSVAAAKERGLEVVGLYVVPKDSKDGLGRVAERVLGQLKERNDAAFGSLVDNAKLGSGEFPYTFYSVTSSATSGSKPTTVPVPSSSPSPLLPLSVETLPAKVLDMIRKDKAHRDLGDFDDHLEDSTVDWLNNPKVKDAISHLSKS